MPFSIPPLKEHILHGSQKGFILDPLVKAAYFVALSITFVIMALMWIKFAPLATTGIPTNSTTYHQIVNLGNGFFINSGDGILVIFFFILTAGMFISAIAIGNPTWAIAVGILIGVLQIIISFTLSDTAYYILTNPQLVPASQYYTGTLYLLENLPVIVAIEVLVYLVFTSVFGEPVRQRLGIQGIGSGSYGMGGRGMYSG